MQTRRQRSGPWSIILGSVVFAMAGCRPAGSERYIPSEMDAQRAVELALTKLKGGKPASTLMHNGPPVIHLIDSHQKPDQKLVSFSIMGMATGDAARCVGVRLTMDNPPEEIRARYVVLGIDPLWVWRYEDYQALVHWDCPMEKFPGDEKEQ